MKLKTLLLVTAVFFIVNAPIALIFPATQLSLYGMEAGPGVNYMAQWAGLGSAAIALMAWFARGVPESEAKRVVLPTLMIYFTLSLIVSVYGVISGVMSAIGWALAGICLLFAVGYGYLLLEKPGLL